MTLAALYGGLLAGLVFFWISHGHLSPSEWLAPRIFISHEGIPAARAVAA